MHFGNTALGYLLGFALLLAAITFPLAVESIMKECEIETTSNL